MLLNITGRKEKAKSLNNNIMGCHIFLQIGIKDEIVSWKISLKYCEVLN